MGMTRRSLLQSGLLALASAFPAVRRAEAKPGWQSALVAAARSQIGVTTLYDPAYVRIAYPGGDVPPERGVCADVVIRAYRSAFGLDLQKLVHQDMTTHFSGYPQAWSLKRPDSNIDHRRVLNLAAYSAAGERRCR